MTFFWIIWNPSVKRHVVGPCHSEITYGVHSILWQLIESRPKGMDPPMGTAGSLYILFVVIVCGLEDINRSRGLINCFRKYRIEEQHVSLQIHWSWIKMTRQQLNRESMMLIAYLRRRRRNNEIGGNWRDLFYFLDFIC